MKGRNTVNYGVASLIIIKGQLLELKGQLYSTLIELTFNDK